MMNEDMSYCATPCDQKDCKRNLKYHKPKSEYYSVTYFDGPGIENTHKKCKWKITA